MTFVTLPGQNLITYPATPKYPPGITSAFNATTLIIDAAGERMAFMGQFWTPDGGAKTIDSVSFLPGAVVSAGGSTLRVSLQNVSTTLSPMQPDGIQDQFRDVALNTVSSNTWFTTGLLTDDGTNGGIKRTVNSGDILAVVFEFQAFAGADIFRLATANVHEFNFGPFSALQAPTWTAQNLPSNVLFTCSDTSIGCFFGAPPRISHPSISYSNASSPDEYGIRFTAPVGMMVEGISWYGLANSFTADFELVLYQNTTVLATIPISGVQSRSLSNNRFSDLKFASKQTLVKDTQYIISIKPTTANTVNALFYQTADTSHINLFPGSVTTELVSRTDLGAWAVDATPTRRLFHLGVLISDIEIPSGGGGGAGAGMTAVLC